MKVALVHYRIAHAGGLERRLLNYMRYFLERGDEVTLLFAQRDPKVQLPKQVILRHLPVRLYPKPFRMGAFGNKVQLVLDKGDYDFDLSLGRTPGAQLLICPGNHRGFLHHMERRWRYTDAIEARLDIKAFESAKHILAASHQMKEELIDWYMVPEEKISVLYPPSDVSHFSNKLKTQQSALRNKWGMSPDKKNFLFVSYSHRRKGLPILLDIFQALQKEPFQLYIAGEKPKRPLPANVTYLDFIEKMPELYAAADYLIHPAFYEPYGQIVTESLQCGTPVLVSATTGAGELLCPDEGMVVPNQQVSNWVQALHELISRNLKVPPKFAERNGLTLPQHMEEMLTIWSGLPRP